MGWSNPSTPPVPGRWPGASLLACLSLATRRCRSLRPARGPMSQAWAGCEGLGCRAGGSLSSPSAPLHAPWNLDVPAGLRDKISASNAAGTASAQRTSGQSTFGPSHAQRCFDQRLSLVALPLGSGMSLRFQTAPCRHRRQARVQQIALRHGGSSNPGDGPMPPTFPLQPHAPMRARRGRSPAWFTGRFLAEWRLSRPGCRGPESNFESIEIRDL